MSVEGIGPVAANATSDGAAMRALIESLGLKPGQSIEARVAAMLADNLARLVIGDAELDVRTPQPLPVGTTLTMTVERQGQQLRLLMQALPAGSPGPASSPAATAAPPAPTAASGSAPMPAPAGPQAAVAMVGALIDLVARESAAPRAAALDGAQATLIARGSPDVSRRLEAGSAGQGVTVTPREALTEAVRAAAARQDSLSPLFADIAALAEGRGAAAVSTLPPPVARALAELLAFRLPAEAAATPGGLMRALAGSVTFLEAGLAAGNAPGADLKAALVALRGALAAWGEGLGLDTGTKSPAAPAGHERPPVRGALPQGQPPAMAHLGAGMDPAETAARLIERTEASLARLVLLQAASLPEPRDLGRPELAPQTWMELPVRIGQATAMVPFQISRDRGEEDGPDLRGQAPAGGWVMRFSLAAEPLGPVHAAVRWREGHVRVQLWAERDGIAARLDGARGALSDALEASAFTIDQLTIRPGRPAEPAPAALTPRLDRRT